MKRRLFNAWAVVSLIWCLAVSGLWVRSYWASDTLYVGLPKQDHFYDIRSNLGSLTFHAVSWSRTRAHGDGTLSVLTEPPERLVDNPLLFVNVAGRGSTDWRRKLVLPHWLALLPAATLPAWCLIRRLRRPRSGVCPACGYDLR